MPHANAFENKPNQSPAETALERAALPKEVFDELAHQESLYPEFHAFNYVKSCTGPEDCIYTIIGSDIVEDSNESKHAKVTITCKKDTVKNDYVVSSTFEHIDHFVDTDSKNDDENPWMKLAA